MYVTPILPPNWVPLISIPSPVHLHLLPTFAATSYFNLVNVVANSYSSLSSLGNCFCSSLSRNRLLQCSDSSVESSIRHRPPYTYPYPASLANHTLQQWRFLRKRWLSTRKSPASPSPRRRPTLPMASPRPPSPPSPRPPRRAWSCPVTATSLPRDPTETRTPLTQISRP